MDRNRLQKQSVFLASISNIPPLSSTTVHLSCISYSVHTSFSLSCVQLTHQAGVLKVSMNCCTEEDLVLEGPSLSSLGRKVPVEDTFSVYWFS